MSTARRLRVAVVNDYAVVVAGVASLLEPYDDIEVVELDSRTPVLSDVDVALYDTFGQAQGQALDLDSFGLRGDATVVVFSWNLAPALVRDTMTAGVGGYVSKGVGADELADALRRAHAGERPTPSSTDEVPDPSGAWPGQHLGLSAREAEVLGLICQGLSNQRIAERIFLGLNTVKTYIRTLYRKIGVDSRSQAVLWGLDHGFGPDRGRVVLADPVTPPDR